MWESQCWNCLIKVVDLSRNCCYHYSFTISAQGVFKQSSEQRVSVRNMGLVLALGLFVQGDDDLLKVTQWQVNRLGLGQNDSLCMRFRHSFWASQIDQIDFGVNFSWCLQICSFYVHNEYTVWSGGCLIHACTADLSQVVAHHEKVESFFFSLTNIDRAISEAKSIFLIFHQCDLGPLFKITVSISFLQQIVGALVVNFDIWNTQFKNHCFLVPVELLKNVTEDAGNYASFLPLITSAHRECFSTACLSVSEYCPVITFQTVVDNRFCQSLE